MSDSSIGEQEAVYLEQLKDQFNTFDFEAYVALMRYVQALEDQIKLPEAAAQHSTILIGPGGAEIISVVRSHSIETAWESMERFVRNRVAQGFKPKIGKSSGATPSQSRESTDTQADSPDSSSTVSGATYNGGDNTFPAEELVANVSGGKAFWKVKGGRFAKFGVTIWPEVLERAGLKNLDPLKVYPLTGMTAHYMVDAEGKPQKVVNLTR